MKNLIYFFLLLLIAFSCVPAYTPNAVNTPLFSSQNEAQFALSTGSSGFDLQTGYAPTNNIGIVVNGSIADRSDSANFHKHNFIEFGGGYYNAMGKHGRFEILGGYGVGNVNAHFKSGIFDGYVKTSYNRIFVQPSIGTASDVFEIAFTPRLVFVKVKSPLDTLNTFPTDPFFEPTLTMKLGWRYVKMTMQFGLSFPLSPYTYYTNEPIIFSIGLLGKIPGKKKEKNTNALNE